MAMSDAARNACASCNGFAHCPRCAIAKSSIDAHSRQGWNDRASQESLRAHAALVWGAHDGRAASLYGSPQHAGGADAPVLRRMLAEARRADARRNAEMCALRLRLAQVENDRRDAEIAALAAALSAALGGGHCVG